MIEESIQNSPFWHKFQGHLKRCQKSQDLFVNSIEISKNEIIEDLYKLFSEKEIEEFFNLTKDLVGNSAWVGNSALKHFSTLLGVDKKIEGNNEDVFAQMIVNTFKEKGALPPSFLNKYSAEDIFKSLFLEIEYHHHYTKNEMPFDLPETDVTVVLVSGVLNEIYKQAAFERGILHLQEKKKLDYFVAKVHGLKGCEANSKMIASQLQSFIQKNPQKKLWIMAFSKGGLDSLHFLKDHASFANKHILGLTTIASPLMGTDQIDQHKFIKLVSTIEKRYDLIFKNKKSESMMREILGQEIRKSLAATKQIKWFKKNSDKLPKNLFYSSLALDSGFFESHIGMMITKVLLPTRKNNDGVVDVEKAHFPDPFKSLKLGTIRGHHLIGARSSTFRQEALMEALLLFHQKLGLI